MGQFVALTEVIEDKSKIDLLHELFVARKFNVILLVAYITFD